MAKQRKQKQRDGKAEGVGGAGPSVTVRHQKLCLAVDLQRKRLLGYTELTVVTLKGGVIGLNARGLRIGQVLVDGIPANYQVSSEQAAQIGGDGEGVGLVEAADAGFAKYTAILQEELVPNFFIYPPEQTVAGAGAAEPAAPTEATDGPVGTPAPSAEADAGNLEEVKVVRVDYYVEEPVTGAFFVGDTLHVNNQLRHARFWFPCIDSSLQRCSYDMEFMVDSNYMAVSNGKLLHQVANAENPGFKTFVYKVTIPTAASFISLVVAPLVVLPDRSNLSISHFCMPGDVAKLQCTVRFFHPVFSFFEEYLGAPFPYQYYKNVFIDVEAAVSASYVSASVVTFSSHLLMNERIIDQAVNTRIRLASALAQQWFGVFITPETSSDAWLLEGLAGFLSELYIKRYLGNNEACYRQYKAMEAVCMVDVKEVPPLCIPLSAGIDLYGTEIFGALGQIRAWKSVAVVQMLEKQMGPETFRKILQRIILRAQDPDRDLRTLSTKEFRHFAIKVGNLERPFLKDFFPRWVESQGCPRLRLGFAYNKRRNMVELAVHRSSTDALDTTGPVQAEAAVQISKNVHPGWPGMMSVRIYELDGMYDHPSLPMAGDSYQLLELQCHSKLAGRRIPRPKKGNKADATDDFVEIAASQSLESPVLWLRVDPGMEYLAEIHLYQPEQMWINQLERERDVAGQILAISELRAFSRPSFAVVNALNNCLHDRKVFCRVRIEAASALASTASEATNWAGLAHLIKYFKSCCFDPNLGLPKPNNFQDLAEYFVLQAIPEAVAAVRGPDGKSPLEAAEFILEILKHNDNTGNAYSDVFWLASVIESIGNFSFGQQTTKIFLKILKQIDHFLQYDRIMPSFNGVLTISCIRTLTKLALKFPRLASMKQMQQLLPPLKDAGCTHPQVRIAALQALLDIECQSSGLDGALRLAVDYIVAEPTWRVQTKVMAHVVKISVLQRAAGSISGSTLQTILSLLESSTGHRNVRLRHDIFCVLQVLAGRPASLYRPEDHQSQRSETPPPVLSTPQARCPKSRDSLKVKADASLNRTDTLRRIRVVPVRSGALKDSEITPTNSASSSGGGRLFDDKKVGKVTLRLKPSLELLHATESTIGQDRKSTLIVEAHSTVLDEAHSEAFPLKKAPSSHAKESMVVLPPVDQGIPGLAHFAGKDVAVDSFETGHGLMGLLTAESPVPVDVEVFGELATRSLAGTAERMHRPDFVGEVQGVKVGIEGFHAAAAGGTSKSLEASLQGDENKLQNAGVAASVKAHKKDKKKRDKKDKKRKHHKDGSRKDIEGPDKDKEGRKKKKRKKEEGNEEKKRPKPEKVKQVTGETPRTINNTADLTALSQPPLDGGRSNLILSKPSPPDVGGDGIKANSDGVLRLKIKKSKVNF